MDTAEDSAAHGSRAVERSRLEKGKRNMHSFSFRRSASCLALALAALLSGCSRSPEAQSARYIESGKALLAKKDTSRAVLQFQNAVQAMPRNAEAHYQLSLAYFRAGDMRSSITEVRKALQLNPKHVGAQMRLAELMAATTDPGMMTDAQNRLRELLKDNSDNAEALHALALTELKLGEPEAGIAHLQQALALAPTNLLIADSMAEAKLQEKDVKGAEEILRKVVQDTPKSSDAWVVLGRFYSSQSRGQDAEGAFQQAVALDPKSAPALLDLANLQESTGRKSEAEQTLKRLATLPGFKASHAMFLYQDGRRDEAIRELEVLVKQDPEDRQARTYLVAAYRTNGKASDAEKVLNEALKKNGKDGDALLQRGEIFIASGKYNQAELDLDQVLHLYPDSAVAAYTYAKLQQARGANLAYRQYLLKALELDPTLLTVRLEAAQNLLSGKDPSGAIGLLDQAPTSQKELPAVLAARNWALWARGDMAEMRKGIDRGLAMEKSGDFLLQDGVWNLRMGRFAAARAALEAALKINPTDIRALSALSQSYAAQKQNALALQKVKEFAAQQPKSAPVQEFLGVLLMANGKPEEARSAFLAAKADDSKYVVSDLSLVQSDVSEGQLDDAQKRLHEILTSDPSNSTARLWLGSVEFSKGNLKEALDQIGQVVAAQPNNAQALNNYAYLLSEAANQPEQALKYAQKAKELAPQDAAYSDTLGWILYRKGLYSLAVTELERVAVTGGAPAWKYHLAMAYAKAGNVNRGKATLEAAMKLNPNLPEAKMAQQVFNSLKP